MTDLDLETGEAALLASMRAQWRRHGGRKSYITGGLGAHHSDEAFGDPFELPRTAAYGETCAAIASVMWCWRMLLATGDARYADHMERTLYNGFLSGLALDGGGSSTSTRCSARRPPRRGRARRAAPPWYDVRLLPAERDAAAGAPPALPGHRDAGGVQIHQYATGDGAAGVRVATDYPWDGRVELEVLARRRWALGLRVPAWAQGARLEADGEEHDAPAGDYARIERRWTAGDRVTLELPLRPRLTAPHPRIDAVNVSSCSCDVNTKPSGDVVGADRHGRHVRRPAPPPGCRSKAAG